MTTTLPVLTPGAEAVATYITGTVVRGRLVVETIHDRELWSISGHYVMDTTAGHVFATDLRLAADVDAEAHDAVLDEVLAAVAALPSDEDEIGALFVDLAGVLGAINNLRQVRP